MAFDNFPYTNFHELNADWMLQTLKTLRANVEAAIQSMESVLQSLQAYNNRLSHLEAGAVMFTEPQSRPAAERAQARQNIAAIGLPELDARAVRFDQRQQLTEEQQITARGNIMAAPFFGTLRYDELQVLADSYQAQARQNIAALGIADLNAHAVRYDAEQQLTEQQQETARENIGAISAADIPTVSGTVQYDQVQTLTDSQKARARNNISAAAVADIPDVTDVIRYSAQSLTAGQKAQARENIGVSGSADQPLMVTVSPNELETGYVCDTSVADILDASDYGRLIIIIFTPVNETAIYQCVAYIDSLASPNTVIAYAYNPEEPGALAPFNWYRIYMTAGSDSDTLTVNQLSGLLIQPPQASDAGKLLTVSSTGRPTWVQKDPTVVTDLGSSSITLAPQDNTEYNYGELSSLTITNPPSIGAYSIVFTSGATATTTTIPATILGLENFVTEANTLYEINVLDNRAVVGSWAVGA